MVASTEGTETTAQRFPGPHCAAFARICNVVKNNPQHLSYYERLGIPEDVSVEGIERAYKELRKQFHPDTKPPAYRDYFDHSMKGINEAYDVLKDPSKRQRYDLKLSKERRSARESHQKPQQSHKGGRYQKRGTAEKKSNQRTGKQHDLTLSREGYEHGLRMFQRNIKRLKDLVQKTRTSLAEANGGYEDLSAKLATFLDSAEAREDPRTRLWLIEKFKATKRNMEQYEESMKIWSLSSLREMEEINDALLESLLYIENHLPNIPTGERVELQAKYNKLMQQLYSLLNHKLSS